MKSDTAKSRARRAVETVAADEGKAGLATESEPADDHAIGGEFGCRRGVRYPEQVRQYGCICNDVKTGCGAEFVERPPK